MGAVSLPLLLLLVLRAADCTTPDLTDSKQGVKMGISSAECDDGKVGLEKDWDGSADAYTCSTARGQVAATRALAPDLQCDGVPQGFVAQHHCMNETVEYSVDIPTYGPHRPLWAKFGEYRYLPPQRWLHDLEHGVVAMLYHPCADSGEVDKLRHLVHNCLRKHVITPSNKLSLDRPLALVAWGCKIEMAEVDAAIVRDFIRNNALKGPGTFHTEDGQFDVGLLHVAETLPGSDVADSVLCPNQP